jgi:hypothetical protein
MMIIPKCIDFLCSSRFSEKPGRPFAWLFSGMSDLHRLALAIVQPPGWTDTCPVGLPGGLLDSPASNRDAVANCTRPAGLAHPINTPIPAAGASSRFSWGSQRLSSRPFVFGSK